MDFSNFGKNPVKIIVQFDLTLQGSTSV